MKKLNINDLINQEQNFVIEQIRQQLCSIKNYDEFKLEISNALNVLEYKFNSSYKTVIREIWYTNSGNLDRDVIEEIYSREINTIDYAISNIMNIYIYKEKINYLEAWEKTRKKLVNGEYSINKIAENYK